MSVNYLSKMRVSAVLVLVSSCLVLSAADQYPLATKCPIETCVRPQCACSSDEIPSELPPNKIPQIVTLSFDDGMNVINYALYQRLLDGRNNSNGCPITATFFLSHLYTDYSLVHKMWTKRHEIASHSISHNVTTFYWKNATKEVWRDEIVGMRQMASEHAKVPESDIIGMRAPFLHMGGNNMYEMLSENGFTYDNSWPTQQSTHLWPYTLDYASKQKCQIYPCPESTPNVSLPGLWVIPMIDLIGDNQFPCAMLDACIVDETEEAVFNMLLRNFNSHYEGERGHFGLYQHSAWFQYPGHTEGFIKFLDHIQTLDDVYIVSLDQFLAWTKDPTPLDRVKDFEPWRASCEPRENTCRPVTCMYSDVPGIMASEIFMTTCSQSCPDEYPWVGNPPVDIPARK